MPALVLPTLENNIEMAKSSSESEFGADFSEEEFTDSDDQHINEAGQIVPYMYEPEAKAATVTTEVKFPVFIAADRKI